MPAILLVLFFLVLGLGLETDHVLLLQSQQRQAAEPAQITTEASELQTFYQASLKFLAGFSSPANGEYIQVSDLQEAGLIPQTFPQQTPFGQTLEGWAVASTSNPLVTNLIVLPVGPFSIQAVIAAGLAPSATTTVPPGIIQAISTQVETQASTLLTDSSNNTQSQETGLLEPTDNGNLQLTSLSGAVLAANTGIPSRTLGSSPDAPGLMAVAPNQVGYTVFAVNLYTYASPWGQAFVDSGNWNLDSKTIYQETETPWVFFQSFEPNLSLLGWSPVCPMGAVQLTPGMTPLQQTQYELNKSKNISPAIEFCLPSYRSEAINQPQGVGAQQDSYSAIRSNSPFYTINNGAGEPLDDNSPVLLNNPTTSQTIASPPAGIGLTYSDGGSNYQAFWQLPYTNPYLIPTSRMYNQPDVQGDGQSYYGGPAQNNFWQETIPVGTGIIGLNLTALEPDSDGGTQVITYQIFFGGYQIATGTGGSWNQLNLPTPEATSSNSGFDGFAWPGSQYTLYDGMQCPPGSPAQNVLSTQCQWQSTLGTAETTDGWYLDITAVSGTDTDGGTVPDITYGYNSDGQQYSSFSINVPANLMVDLHY